MVWLRKLVVWLLSVVLFLALIGGVTAISVVATFIHPAKLEVWLAQSGFYQNFSTAAAQQTSASIAENIGSQANAERAGISDSAVRRAADSAFPPALLEQSTNTILNNNYAWLEGKLTAPDFSIDLTSARQDFIQKIAQDAQLQLANLSVCTPAQLPTQLALVQNPLALSCRPAVLSPAAVSNAVMQQLAANNQFLSDPVITAKSLNTGGGQPYYQQFSFAPRLYHNLRRLPWLLGALAVLCTLGIIAIMPRKRRAVRRLGIVLAAAGVVLVALKLAADTASHMFINGGTLFNQVNSRPLQHSLVSFLQHIETQLFKIPFYCGIGFMAAAVLAFIFLIGTRRRGRSAESAQAPRGVSTGGGEQPDRTSSARSKAVSPRRENDSPKRPLIQ